MARKAFKWGRQFSIGIKSLDDPHKYLFKQLIELDQAIDQNKVDGLKDLFQVLDVFCLYHFTAEESLMAKYGYPNLIAHRRQHDAFREKIEDFKELYSQDNLCLAIELRDYIQEWIVNHITNVDRMYVPYLPEKMKA